MPAGAPKNNKNAEKWTEEAATELFEKAIKLTQQKTDGQYDYDFIGQIARELETFKEIFTYLVGRFPSLKNKHNIIISNCEANCYYNGKNQNIVPSLAIMNLKSNHGWTDRVDQTTGGEKTNSIKVSEWVDGTNLGQSAMDSFNPDEEE